MTLLAERRTAIGVQAGVLRNLGITVQVVGAFTLHEWPLDTLGRITQGYYEGLPLSGRLTSLYGSHEQFRIDMGLGPHSGCDIDDDREYKGPIYNPAPGLVTIVRDDPLGGGHWLKIDHQQGVRSSFLHMDTPPHYAGGAPIRVGDWINRGVHIGRVGTTGKWSTGTHLHWAVTVTGLGRIDPLALVVPFMVWPEIEQPERRFDANVPPTPWMREWIAVDSYAQIVIPDVTTSVPEWRPGTRPDGTPDPEYYELVYPVRRPWLVPDRYGRTMLPPEGD